jgi:hypothetical protein
MSWLALLLIGIGLADLGHSIRPVRWFPELVGAGFAVVLGLLADLDAGRDAVALGVIALFILAWGSAVRHGIGAERAWLPLLLLGSALSAALAGSVYAGSAGGLVADWLARTAWDLPSGMSADEALLVFGGLLAQLSTGNVVVRLVLQATGTIGPVRDPSRIIKGGRLLGPMERLMILGLGLAGHLTAASVVVAAKGLLRFPELQARGSGAEIDEITEYFLVGSFVSWLIPLTTLVLIAH